MEKLPIRDKKPLVAYFSSFTLGKDRSLYIDTDVSEFILLTDQIRVVTIHGI